MTRERILYVIIAGLVIALLTMIKCEGDNASTKTTVKQVPYTIPAQGGIFDKPTNQSEIPSAGKDSIVFYDKLIYIESPVNKETVEKYKSAQNEIDRLNILLDGIRQREYISNFEDNFISIQAKTKVEGQLKDLQLSYNLKPREVLVPETTIEKTIIQKDNFGWLAGGGVKQNLETQDLNYEVNAGIRLGKISILGSANTRKEAGLSAIIEF